MYLLLTPFLEPVPKPTEAARRSLYDFSQCWIWSTKRKSFALKVSHLPIPFLCSFQLCRGSHCAAEHSVAWMLYTHMWTWWVFGCIFADKLKLWKEERGSTLRFGVKYLNWSCKQSRWEMTQKIKMFSFLCSWKIYIRKTGGRRWR